jgi:putative nucleotidyltransferase with HDIG domain
MSNSSTNRNRWIVPAPKPPLAIVADFLKRSDVWSRIGLCALTTTILWIVMFGWAPPFSYRLRQEPMRDMHARVTFDYPDYKTTEEERDRRRQSFLCYYENDEQPLEQLRQSLIDVVFQIKQKDFEEIDQTELWRRFFESPSEEGDAVQPAATKEQFEAFREALVKDEKLDALRAALDKAFIEIDENGILETTQHEVGAGSQVEIEVYPKGDFQNRHRVSLTDVRLPVVREELKRRLVNELTKEPDIILSGEMVAERVYQWLKPQLPTTLKYDKTNTTRAIAEAVESVETRLRQFKPGEQLEQYGLDLELQGIRGGVPLDEADLKLLRAEHEAYVQSLGLGARIVRSILFFGLFAAVFLLIVPFLYYRDQYLLDDLRNFAILLGLILVTLTIAWLLSLNVEWRAEVIPVMIFAMTISIAFHIELAIILGALVSLAFSVAHDYGLSEFVVLTAASSSSALLCGKIRSRTKLVYVGLTVAVVVFPTVIGVRYMLGQSLGMALLTDAAWFASGAGFAGLIMTALLPFLEQWFDIQTDISLLELSDANHPLLKELVQRAPGTYNHSINVASISEAAADAIGANGLLCRVGAYFHDVGKLRKPEYFIENQSGGVNKHDDLVPTMSTLVIIAHVKDGAEIGRMHRLPQRIIDLIEQHHGTTLVEYFFKRAEKQLAERCEGEPGEAVIDEADFRYPGPKPQTTEAAVLMLADTVESASRALREPAPARIKSLVHEITKKKMDDGQFNQCPITVEQLKIIQDSLIKSLNAMYHARVQYPEQQQSA